MARTLVCDICKQPTASIVAKMFYSETGKEPLRSKAAKSIHNNYSKHLDVGECCGAKVLTAFGWRNRMTAEEYHKSRAKSTKGGRRAPAVENKQAEGV